MHLPGLPAMWSRYEQAYQEHMDSLYDARLDDDYCDASDDDGRDDYNEMIQEERHTF